MRVFIINMQYKAFLWGNKPVKVRNHYFGETATTGEREGEA